MNSLAAASSLIFNRFTSAAVALEYWISKKGQVKTDETENWNGKLKAETEKLKIGNGR